MPLRLPDYLLNLHNERGYRATPPEAGFRLRDVVALALTRLLTRNSMS